MHTFKDSQGREWRVELNGWQLKKVHERLGVQLRDPQSVLTAADDPVLVIDILYVLCEEQCKERGMSDVDFGKSLGGDAIDEAVEAYIAEVVPFLPSIARQTVAETLNAWRSYQTKAATMAERKATSPEMANLIATTVQQQEQKIDLLLAGNGTGNSSGKSPALPA